MYSIKNSLIALSGLLSSAPSHRPPVEVSLLTAPMNPITLRFSDPLERDFTEDYFRKSLRHVRFAVLSGMFLYGVFGYMDVKLIPESKDEIWLIRYGVVCPFLLAFSLFTYHPLFRRHMQASLCLPILIPGVGLIAMMVISPKFGDYYYPGLMLVIMYSYTFIRLRFVYATFCSLAITVTYHVVSLWVNHAPFLVVLNNDFELLAANYIGMFSAYLLEQHFRKDFLNYIQLEAEQAKSNHLLLNILPASIAARLKEGHLIVDSFPESTVLFTDIAGFTRISSKFTPEELVTLMNEVFSAFDRVVEKHGVEKIKTIGDAYMLAAGVPIPRSDHAEVVAEVALDMQAEIALLRASQEGWLRIRTGVHS
ncbi:MAG: hypothetical protein H0V18_18710, partial [Pyrinomonadaceae bacterium]|nr:hypothetical protein [Pyrinomonadaceae bacterium]